jgi:hypothetical protein
VGGLGARQALLTGQEAEMRALIVTAIVGIVIVSGCHDATAPRTDLPRTAPIDQIQVTAHAATTDTIFIRFTYITAPCDTSAIGVRQTSSTVRITATAYPTNRPCVADIAAANDFRYMVLPYHTAPYTVIFTQPSGNDSVRVVPR